MTREQTSKKIYFINFSMLMFGKKSIEASPRNLLKCTNLGRVFMHISGYLSSRIYKVLHIEDYKQKTGDKELFILNYVLYNVLKTRGQLT